MSVRQRKRMNRITIRPLKESELKDLVGLWVESGLPYKAKGRDSTANLKRQRKDDPELFVGGFDGEKMVGAAIASDDGRKAWINRLAVLPDARRKGVASLLIHHCEDVLRRRGRHIFCVHIEHDNPESMELFDKIGYCREDQIAYYTKRESDDY